MRQNTSSHQIYFQDVNVKQLANKATDTLIVIQQLLMAQLGNVEQLVHEPRCLFTKKTTQQGYSGFSSVSFYFSYAKCAPSGHRQLA